MWRDIFDTITWENREKCMDMRNVAQLVCILSMLDQSDTDYEIVRSICTDVFGGEHEYTKAMNVILNSWSKQSDEEIGKLFLELLREIHVTLKADLEADALKEKENAS